MREHTPAQPDERTAQAVQEIVRLHDLISAWFRGEVAKAAFEGDFADALDAEFQNVQPSGEVLQKADLVEAIRSGHGANPAFRITIEAPQLIANYPSQILISYVEFQQGAQNSEAQNRRRSTVLFETGGSRLIWRYLHETGLP